MGVAIWRYVGISYHICIYASPFVIAEDEWDETRNGGIFVGKQSVRSLEVYHSV